MASRFDQVIDRKDTGSFKWSDPRHGLGKDDIIPMWVADMDFRCADPIVEAVTARAQHGVYGYGLGGFGESGAEHRKIIASWMEKRFGFRPDETWLTFAPPGVIFAVSELLNIITGEGDGVLIIMPNYDPLFDAIRGKGLKLVESRLTEDEQGLVRVDFADLEAKLSDPSVKAMIISNPHNPSGRVWTEEELRRMSELCLQTGTFLISDEIHADFVSKEARHVPVPSLGPTHAQNAMACYSANKGFNLGGLQTANIVIGDPALKEKFDHAMVIAQTRLDNIFGTVATEAAYTDPESERWLDEAIAYVEENKRVLYEFAKRELPEIKVMPSQGTYLVWVDFSVLGLSGKELHKFFMEEARVEPCMGWEFDTQDNAFIRLNLACPRSTVEKALERIKQAVNRRLKK